MAILDKADALRQKRREAIAKLDQLLQSVFLEMFGDPVANPNGFDRVSLAHLISDGPQNGLYKPSSSYGSGTPILRIDVFRDGEHVNFELPKRLRLTDQERAKYSLKENDVVINRVNSPEHLGKVALIARLKEPAVFESNMMRFALDTDRAESEYVGEALRRRYVKQVCIGLT